MTRQIELAAAGTSPFSIRAAFSLIKVNFLEKLVYRFDLVVGLVRTFILVLVFHQLWAALYGGNESYAGVSVDQTLTYVVMSISIAPLFPNSLIMQVGGRIRSGDILFDIARPMYYGNLLLFQMIGRSLVILVTSSLPLLVMSRLLLGLALPASVTVWLAFLVSLILGFLIGFLIDFTASLSGFWLMEVHGIRFAKWSISDILGGKFMPLWVFPSPFKEAALLLPFRGVSYTPLAILVGQVAQEEIVAALGFQLVWVLLLALLSRAIYGTAVKKLTVQGG